MKFGNGLLLLMTKLLQVRHFNPHWFFFLMETLVYTFKHRSVISFFVTMSYNCPVNVNGGRVSCQGWRESPLTCYL